MVWCGKPEHLCSGFIRIQKIAIVFPLRICKARVLGGTMGGHKKRSIPFSRGVQMKRLFLAASALALIWGTGHAKADLYDPLHFTCATCLNDNGTFTPAPGGFSNISVTASPAQSGTDFLIKVLVPNDLSVPTGTVTGTVGATAFSASFTNDGVWTGTPNSLEGFL